MSDQQRTCQVPMHDGKPCGRPIHDAQKCICHSEDAQKEPRLFYPIVQKLMEDDEVTSADCTSFVFPDIDFTISYGLKKPAIFAHARFLGNIRFTKMVFKENADFRKATFEKSAIFQGAVFEREASFSGAEFKGMTFFSNCVIKEGHFEDAEFLRHVSFSNARFLEYASFSSSIFAGESLFNGTIFEGAAEFVESRLSGSVSFSGCQFQSVTLFQGAVFSGRVELQECKFGVSDRSPSPGYVFRNARFEGTARVMFDGTDAKGNRGCMFLQPVDFKYWNIERGASITFRRLTMDKCYFLETDLSQISFRDVVWPSTGRRVNQRKFVADEPVARNLASTRYAAVAQLYRGLQASYTETLQYREAGDFFIGEQIMMRRAKKHWWQKIPNFVYEILSYYGERYWRPLGWLLATLLVFPIFLMYGMTGGYDWSWSPSDFLLLTKDYGNALLLNFQFVTFSRSEVSQYLTEPYQQFLISFESLWVAVLVAFVVLALRRVFRRKSF